MPSANAANLKAMRCGARMARARGHLANLPPNPAGRISLEMHGPAASAMTVMLFGLSGLLLLASAASWAKLARDREPPSELPAIPVRQFRAAAAVTAAAFVMLGLAVCWLALLSI